MSHHDASCSCCGDAVARMPERVSNRPGLRELRYRIATHARFKQHMLGELSRQPALRKLSTRRDDDPAIALVDAWASVLDVLTFYQERIANEGYLRTATERRSVLELARAIGYELNPGVAATTLLAFSVEHTPGGAETVRLEPGLKVQSVPGQDELPQLFETVEGLRAHPAYNRLVPRQHVPQLIGRNTTRLFLEGLGTGLQPGDRLLLVGPEREESAASERWDVRTLLTVTPIPEEGYTVVTWQEALGHSEPQVEPSSQPRAFVFRRRSAPFGHNAPDWRVMPDVVKKVYDDPMTATDWPDFKIDQGGTQPQIDLEAFHPELAAGSWLLLEASDHRELYRVQTARAGSRTDYTLTARTTRLTLDTRLHLEVFGPRETVAWAVSEELPLAEPRWNVPVFQQRLQVEGVHPALEPGRKLLLSGLPVTQVRISERSRTRLQGSGTVTETDPVLLLTALDGSSSRPLAPGQVLKVEAVPVELETGLGRWTLRIEEDGFVGTVDADDDDLEAVGAPRPQAAFKPVDTNGFTTEPVSLERAEVGPEGFTTLVLSSPLRGIYHRATAYLHGNVVKATHGETRSELLGSGNHGTAMQQFTLRQMPLTHVSAPGAQGARSTLQLRVAGIAWEEVPSLYGQPPDARVFTQRRSSNGTTSVQFGDGINGARLPTGPDNVSAVYRIGTGLAGQVRAGQLQLLMSRPLGVRDVTNPLPARGAEDPEHLEQARQNAPMTVVTLERIVSARDFEDFARAFAGIGKAQATVLWSGEHRLVHLTIAAVDGGEVPEGSELLSNLRTAIAQARHGDQEVRLGSFTQRLFSLKARVRVEPAYPVQQVLGQVSELLKQAYGFEARGFGEAVTASELQALIHQVPGVEAVVLTELDGLEPVAHPRVLASIAHWDASQSCILPAELLLLDPQALSLEELS